MLIVLDTTETFNDLRLEGPDFRFLSSYVARHPVKLFIPRIVVQETANHFRESLEQAHDKLRAAGRGVTRLAPELEVTIHATFDAEQILATYKTHLDKRLKILSASLPNYDTVKMEVVVERALQRRKPFDPEGRKGFRDALVWETVLELLRQHRKPLILVTKNKRDFGEHGKLADDLLDDLKQHGLADLQVTVCEGLARFVEEQVKPELQRLDEIQTRIQEQEWEIFNAYTFFTEQSYAIRDDLKKDVRKLDLDRVARECHDRFDRPSLGYMEDGAFQFEVADVWQIDEDQIGIGIDYYVEGSIACQREVETEPYGEPMDEDFEGRVQFRLLMTVVVSQSDRDVISWELNEVEVELMNGWPLPDYE